MISHQNPLINSTCCHSLC